MRGGGFTCGVTSKGAAFCWGDNSSGELGNGRNLIYSVDNPYNSGSSSTPIAVMGGLFLIYMVAISLIATTLKGILLAATYQFASTGSVPSGFNQDMLSQAFKQKGQK